jgi:cell division protease FtsH
MDSYSRATELLQTHKKALLDIADALLAREVLDADQVRKLARGEKLEDLSPLEPSRPADDTARDRARDTKERPPLVPGISKPLTQE